MLGVICQVVQAVGVTVEVIEFLLGPLSRTQLVVNGSFPAVEDSIHGWASSRVPKAGFWVAARPTFRFKIVDVEVGTFDASPQWKVQELWHLKFISEIIISIWTENTAEKLTKNDEYALKEPRKWLQGSVGI
jgi:hypothetical protein